MQYEAMRRRLTVDFPQGGLCQAVFEAKDEAAAARVKSAFGRMKIQTVDDGPTRVRVVFDGSEFGRVATAVAGLHSNGPGVVKYLGPPDA